jgi:aromatic ring-opening dioxygenase LigB subunit
LALYRSLRNEYKQNVSGLVAWSYAQDVPIDWAEIIPLWFFMTPHQQDAAIAAVLAEEGGESEEERVGQKCLLSRAIIFTQPVRRAILMIDELLHVGELTMKYLESLPQTVYIVISSDLAHTHRLATTSP